MRRAARRAVDPRALAGRSRRAAPRRVIRPLTPADAEEIAALYVANREFLAPFEPDRTEEFFTAEFQRQRIEVAGDDHWRWGDRRRRRDRRDDRARRRDPRRAPARERRLLGRPRPQRARARDGGGGATSSRSRSAKAGCTGSRRARSSTTTPRSACSRRTGSSGSGSRASCLRINGEWRDHVLFERIAD